MNDQEIIDSLLQDPGFRSIVESDLGRVIRVQVDWPKNEIRFYGTEKAKVLLIDATLAELKGQIQ